MSPMRADILTEAVNALISSLPAEVNEKWFQDAACGLATAVGADLAMIGRLVDDGRGIQTLGFCENRAPRPNIHYDLKGTPCEDVLKETVCVIEDDVVEAYPEDPELKELRAVGYVGQPIFGPDRKLLGIVNAIYRTPVRDAVAVRGAFEAFSKGISTRLRDELDHWVDPPSRN